MYDGGNKLCSPNLNMHSKVIEGKKDDKDTRNH